MNRDIEDLRIHFAKQTSNYDSLTAAERQAILENRAAADQPQSIDYGLTCYDLLDNFDLLTGRTRQDGLKYKDGKRWLSIFLRWQTHAYSAGGLGFWFVLFGFLATRGKNSSDVSLGFILLGFGLVCMAYAILPKAVIAYQRKHPSPGLLRYREAVLRHQLYEVAAYDAKETLLRKQLSYWECLDGYQFERATSEVLEQHHFNPRVTKGSGDGGVDIEVVRAGRKGVVQCKAHVACVGPHTVRDLFGVIHHSSADFGIIVSRGGFTKGAMDFAKDKPIFLLDSSDLIAMQEGTDVLSQVFDSGV